MRKKNVKQNILETEIFDFFCSYHFSDNVTSTKKLLKFEIIFSKISSEIHDFSYHLQYFHDLLDTLYTVSQNLYESNCTKFHASIARW